MAKQVDSKRLRRQLREISRSAEGKALRKAAVQGMLPAMRAAQAAAPVGNPPYEYNGRLIDPYPTKTYLGRYKAPGFTKRHIKRKSIVYEGGVKVLLGVAPEAFYALSFIELGTSKIAKRPWLEPSFRASISAVDARFKKRLKAILDKAARS